MFKRTRKLIATIGLAVAVGAPLTPARALVPTAWARSPEGFSVVIKTDWDETKRARQKRDIHNFECNLYFTRHDCENPSDYRLRCKWQKGTLLHPKQGYCYNQK